MDYDLNEGSRPLDADTTYQQIKELYDMNMYRGRSEEWAFKDIQFLIFDDTDEVKVSSPPSFSGYDSNDEESMLQYAMKMSQKTGDMTHEQPDTEGRKNLPSDNKPGGCEVCSRLPEFPHDRKPRKLRLFRVRDALSREEMSNLKACIHYVPMSYCWPSRPKDESGNPLPVQGTYEIRELDGTTRMNRASDEIIDRAIDFAQTCGLRMVWVDQECLPQQDSEDREIGLQAMDIVYHRAIVTAGLHSTIMASLYHIGAIQQLVYAFKSVRKGALTWGAFEVLPLPTLIPIALDFIDKVRQEKWYQRAWIAQESISSSGKLFLVFPLAPGLRLGIMEQRHRFKETLGSPAHSLDKVRRVLPATQWSIKEDHFRLLVEGITRFYRSRDQAGGSSSLLALKLHAVPILRGASALWPVTQQNSPTSAYLIGGASYGFRRRLNAAGALTLFRTRHCTRPHDRLAIMANMCGYDMRLDTRAVKTHGGSLRVALLALAMLNSDLSLLVPELYRPIQDHGVADEASDLLNPRSNTRLIQPFDTSAHLIDFSVAEQGHRIRPRSTAHLMQHDVRRSGLSFPAYIWTVEDRIDLMILKDQWEDTWKRLKASQVDHVSIDTREDTPLLPAFVQRSQDAQRQLVEIIFSILKYLHGLSASDSRAEGVADSIWHSIRAGDVVDTRFPGKLPPLPDNVGPALFNHLAVQVCSWATLQLDHSLDGKSYNQLWFIERIMTDGALWVGRYTRIAPSMHSEELYKIVELEEVREALRSEEVCKALLSDDFREALQSEDIHKLLGSEQARGALKSEEARELLRSEEVRKAFQSEEVCKLLQWEEVRNDLKMKMAFKARPSDMNSLPQDEPCPGNSEDEGPGSSKDAVPRDSPREGTGELFSTIMGRQLIVELISTMGNAMSQSLGDVEGDETDRSFWDPAMSRNQMGWLVRTLKGSPYSVEAEVSRTRKLVSVFDVDEPCVVAIPFESDMEVLPRSELRSLSVCWVVEHVADEKIPEGENIAHGKKKATALCDAKIGAQVVEGNKGTRLYRVVAKVRGLWEIMELPRKAHYFT
ncbi:hypothetical protein FSARC_12848 [Fusarium sarcochroum]|uniref:Heterokaryon incompatibility domain-containing protein n=1 Tax=Fusarium sarcochroum TaxID=1208366 RepID=A0A8H4T5D1_9HYPO|nr:hypothetical protein FSARC_12848 [Fusarium sarcochroum]